MNVKRHHYLPLLTLLLLVLVAGCKSAPSGDQLAAAREVALERMERLEWILGDWRMEREDGLTGETWVSATPAVMVGMGYTVKDGQLVAHESMRLLSREGDIYYIAQPGGSAVGVEFRMMEISDRHVLFRNPAHDFPKWIRYERVDPNTCRAIVGGDGRKIEFDYTR